MIRDRSVLALLGGELVSRLGSQIANLALPWFVLVTTGSPTKMTLVFAVELVPVVVLGVAAGSLVQRIGPRAAMLIADGVRAPVIALVLLLHELGGLTFGLILAIAALQGAFSCAYFSCQRVILPAVVGEDERTLGQANTLLEGATNLTQLLGPALAGILIAFVGAANVMWIDAASFFVAFVLVGAFVHVERVAHDPAESGGVLAGFRYLRGDRLVGRVSLTSLTFGFLFPVLVASFSVLAYESYNHNPRIAGLLLSAIGGGQVVGSLAAFRLVAKFPPLRLESIGLIATALPLWLLVPHVPIWLVAPALAIVGCSLPIINAPYITLLQTRVPVALRGKVLQSVITINGVAGPLAYVIAGPLFVHAGLHVAYAMVAALATVASANFIFTVLSEPSVPRAQAAA
ncbi:MAG: MFS transporter [Actinobacteria bacterium]|nr:MFS transporter [Actinomycetota bacterium]